MSFTPGPQLGTPVATLERMSTLRIPGALLFLSLCVACGKEPDLVVYCALDQQHSERIVQLFEERTGLDVRAHYDSERAKTVGLVSALIKERNRPRADIFWNNEIANTIRLKRMGLTQAYASPSAEGIPENFKDPENHWTGFAARARIIMYREDVSYGGPPPQRVDDMVQPQFAPHGAMARPLTGTTLTHFGVLSQQRGNETVLDWLRQGEQAGLRFGPGNADVMRRVCEKDFSWCLTDTDDAAAAKANGHPVKILYPDQEDGGIGTMLIPNTICMMQGARHTENAKRFIDFVLSAEVEAMLANSRSDQIPLRPGVQAPEHIKIPGKDFKVMSVDWEAAGAILEDRLKDFQEMFNQ